MRRGGGCVWHESLQSSRKQITPALWLPCHMSGALKSEKPPPPHKLNSPDFRDVKLRSRSAPSLWGDVGGAVCMEEGDRLSERERRELVLQ